MPEAPRGTPPDVDEKRATPRKLTHVRCWVEDGIARRYARLINLSRGGAMIETAGPPTPGRTILLSFGPFSGDRPVAAEARVIWCSMDDAGRGGVMGVQFLHVSDIGQIDDFLRRG